MHWQLESETGVLTDVLLCEPQYYKGLDTTADPSQMAKAIVPTDAPQAQAQYAHFLEILSAEGVRAHFLVPEPHLCSQVYVRDSSQTTPWGPVLLQLRQDERRGEYAAVLAFHGNVAGLWHCMTDGICEGGDIHIIRPGLLLVGYSGARTTLAGAQQFANWFAAEGWHVRLQPFPAQFLHLDALFCMATPDLAVCCPDVLGPAFTDWLTEQGIFTVPVTYREAMDMCCNLLSLGARRVISARHSTRLNIELAGRGLEVLDPPLDMFARQGRSVHGLTMPLRREALRAGSF